MVQSPKYTGRDDRGGATSASRSWSRARTSCRARLLRGERRSIMPDNYDETLTPEQIEQLVAYLMTLR
jgi:mono/diheme cytochrome c family protein